MPPLRCKQRRTRSPELAANERFQRPPLRFRRLGGGYRKEDVEFALAELRLTLRQLDNDLEGLRDRARELEDELRAARTELETYRGKDAELSQTMSNALRRASEIEEAAQERARAIIASAEEAALRTRSDAHRRIEETGGQFTELVRLKENLVGAMRGVVDEFEEAIARVERGEPIFPGAEPPQVTQVPPPLAAEPPPAPPPSAEPPPALPSLETQIPPPPSVQVPLPPLPSIPQGAPAAPPPTLPAAPEPDLAPPAYEPPPAMPPASPVPAQPPEPTFVAAEPPVPPPVAPPPAFEVQAPPPVAPPPAFEVQAPPPLPPVLPAFPPEPPVSSPAPAFRAPPPGAEYPPSAPASAGDPVFETHVELDAGPFADFASLSAFERALAHLPRVDDVYVRRLADDRALIELTLSEPTALLATMRSSLPYEVDVKSATGSSLVVNVFAHSTAGTRGP